MMLFWGQWYINIHLYESYKCAFNFPHIPDIRGHLSTNLTLATAEIPSSARHVRPFVAHGHRELQWLAIISSSITQLLHVWYLHLNHCRGKCRQICHGVSGSVSTYKFPALKVDSSFVHWSFHCCNARLWAGEPVSVATDFSRSPAAWLGGAATVKDRAIASAMFLIHSAFLLGVSMISV